MSIAAIELWALRTLAVMAAVGALAWWVYGKGEAHIQVKWDAAEVSRKEAEDAQNAKNMADTIFRQAKVAAAEADAVRAHADLDTYRRTHPVSLLACGLHAKAPDHPADSGKGAGDQPAAPGGETGGVVQPPDERDLGPDLDLFAAQADAINSAYRLCLATRPGAH